MGGIDMNIAGAAPGIKGVYSAGESACVSVHGANRLGGNSLLEILVFGKRIGMEIANDVKELDTPPPISVASVDEQKRNIRSFMNHDRYERYGTLREELGETLALNVGIYRKKELLDQGLADVMQLKERFKHVRVHDTGAIFNTNLLQVLELGNMLDLAETVARGALLREESRGSHTREDFPTRDDANWHKHTVYTMVNGEIKIDFKPVTMGKYELQERKY
jgi:succinate dehydrogenase / fumarate reductase flavoprotein subunit